MTSGRRRPRRDPLRHDAAQHGPARSDPARRAAAPLRRATVLAAAALALPVAALSGCTPASLDDAILAATAAPADAAPSDAAPADGTPLDGTPAGEAAAARSGPTLPAARFTGTFIASDPSVIRDGGTLRMSYTDYDPQSGHTVISTAASADGARWTPAAASASAVVRGTAVAPAPGSWRENVEGSALIRTADGYRLYFSGYRDKGHPQKGFPASLGLATSADGANWTVRDAPVIDPSPGWYDNDAIYSPAIIETPDGLFLAYAGHSYTDASRIERPGVYLLGARSADGIRWEKLAAPLLPTSGVPAWMRDGAAEPALLPLADGRWALFFTGLAGEERVIGVATGPAPDGPFEIRPEPLIVPGAPGEADEHQVLAPSALADGDRVRIWYLSASRSGALAVAYHEAGLDEIASR